MKKCFSFLLIIIILLSLLMLTVAAKGGDSGGGGTAGAFSSSYRSPSYKFFITAFDPQYGHTATAGVFAIFAT